MTLTVESATIRISRNIKSAEKALNEALLQQAELMSTLVLARNQVSPNFLSGQDALMRLMKSQQSLLTAGNDLARVHGRMLDISKEMGGTAEDCPDDWRQTGQLDVVNAA